MNIDKHLKRQSTVISALSIFCIAFSCKHDPKPPITPDASFETVAEKVAITPGVIDEASGLASSRNITGFLWTTQDSGAPNSISLISTDGKSVKPFVIPGSVNRDWEEITAGPGPNVGTNYLYIGDIGNNNAPIASTNTIYRIPEIQNSNASFSQSDVEKITFSYPDGAKNSEALIIDPDTKDIFVLSKETLTTGIYRLPYPQSTGDVIEAQKVGTVPSVVIATGSTISKDGSEILIRTYLGVHYWKRTKGETVGQTLIKAATKTLIVELEPQGEAICFNSNETGFYTLSEKSNSTGVTLNFYKRK
ncbi:PE-PGRS family protein [Dyadobacter arcticus]|uniref:PE-PGRS family protein n=1 Tax=Dyadobacter arcticus TaxID=1078754 RepID=A0ABX0UIR5_9BACT|nr:PE-PGRS family protein [Dyadobacter arcticus]NIJ51580.1 hypothetical protein [Dyadobacter arcticus]